MKEETMTTRYRSIYTALVSLALIMVALSGCRNPIHIITASSSWSGPSIKQTKTATVGAEGATKLSVSTDFGSITTKAGPGKTVDVKAEVTAAGSFPEAELKSWLDKVQTTVRRDGQSLI